MSSVSVALLQFILIIPFVLGYDEVADFCSRWDHQSVVKNNRLYIDGGNELFKSESSSGKPYVLGINQKLIEVDLTTSWDWKTNISIIGIEKTANPNTGTSPPSLVRGGIYGGAPTDNNIYILGGTKSQLNSSFANVYPDPSTYSLWAFDTSGQSWNQYDVSAAMPQRPSRGSYAEAPDQGLAFYFNGQIDKGSSTQTTKLGNDTLGMGGLIMLNMTAEAGPLARNLSTSSFGPDAAVASSELVYVSEIGEKGILVEMGGTLLSTSVAADQNGTLVTFDSVNVLDIASAYTGDGNWYKQATSGNAPLPRIDSCSVVAAAPDNSSYNIYLYGGWDPTNGNGTIYDDMYILSLPSFTWTKMYSGESPRFGHTCHLVGNRQLLTVGGSLSTNVTKSCDWETKSVAIMDISTKQWGSVFNAFAAPYQVTSDLLPVIGGTVSGGATMKEPKGGFSDPNLKAVFAAQRATTTTPPSAVDPTVSATGTSKPSKKHSSAGAIAGGVVAAIVGVAVIGGLALFLVRRKRQQAIRLPTGTNDLPPAYEKDANGEGYHEMMGKHHHAELAGGKNTHELPAVVPVYELSDGHSRANSRQNERAGLESRGVTENGSTTELNQPARGT